jgi:hypothetical protein
MGGCESAPEGCKVIYTNNLKAQSHRSVTPVRMNMLARFHVTMSDEEAIAP